MKFITKARIRTDAPARPFNPITLLTRTCFALGGLIAFYWLIHIIWPRALPAPVVPDPTALVAHVVTTPAPNPTIVAAITERPLFLPERRGQPGEDPAGGSAMPPGGGDALADARLVGIAGDADGGIAIISRGGAPTRVRQGEQFEGWMLETLEDRSARFTNEGGEVRELHLTYKEQPQGWAEAPPGGMPPIAGNVPAPPPGGFPAPPGGFPAFPDAQQPDTAEAIMDQQSMEEAVMAARRARQEAMMLQGGPEQ
jgi:hypothetical protein